MSAKNKVRIVWIFPVVLVASWIAVRTLSASPKAMSTTVAVTVVAPRELRDPSLHGLIGRLAESARTHQRSSR